MDHALISEHTEEASDKCENVDESEDRNSKEKLLLLRLQL